MWAVIFKTATAQGKGLFQGQAQLKFHRNLLICVFIDLLYCWLLSNLSIFQGPKMFTQATLLHLCGGLNP